MAEKEGEILVDDLISRKALLEVVGKMPLCWEYGQAVSDVYDIIKSMPTLTLDDLRPKGRWERHEDGKIYCNVCKKKALEVKKGVWHIPNFCNECGADMRGGGEDA